MTKVQTIEKVAETAAKTPVPVPITSEIQDGVQIFLELEPYAQKAVLALVHHFHKAPPAPATTQSVGPITPITASSGKA